MNRKSVAAAVAVAVCSAAGAADYSPGFVWDRSLDWNDGKVAGYGWQNGNPDDDKNDNPAWVCEWSKDGGGLGDPNPWYKQPKTLMVWDPNWYNNGYPTWARSNDGHPNIAKTGLTHVVYPGNFPDAPLVRWMNPTGAQATVDITGNFKINWSGQGNLDVPLSCDLAVVAVTGTQYAVLFGESYNDPSPGDQNIGSRTIQINLQDVVVPEGGSILIGLRGQTAQSNRWFSSEDNLKITLEALEGGGGCTPDIDGNGVLDLFDFLAFVNLFNAGC
jgi:hypothetical protein